MEVNQSTPFSCVGIVRLACRKLSSVPLILVLLQVHFSSEEKLRNSLFSLQAFGLLILTPPARFFFPLSSLHLFFQQQFVIADEAAGGSHCDAEFSAAGKNVIDGALDWAAIKTPSTPRRCSRDVFFISGGAVFVLIVLKR